MNKHGNRNKQKLVKLKLGDLKMKKLFAWREAYLRNEDGATAIEYGLIAAGIALAISVVVFTMGDELRLMFDEMETEITTANASAAGRAD